MMKRFMLINAIDPYKEVQYRFPSLGLGYLVSALRGHFKPGRFEFKVVDRNVAAALKQFKPDIVGISCVSQNYEYAKDYAYIAKQQNVPVIMGGIHISTLPNTMTEDMDVAVLGEGEQTIIELMEAYLSGATFANVKGIAYRDGDELVRTEPRPMIDPIDQLARPARDVLKFHSYANIFSSRGCPYRCTFCFSTRFWDRVRFFSAEYVLEEIKEMVGRHRISRISFYDDLMIADLKRLEALVSMIRREPMLDGVKFGVNARANLITDDTARLMKEMGVDSVGMGLESGNARTLKYLKGGSVSVGDNYEAIRTLHRHGIAANASFIIGCPDETEEEMLDTLRFIKTSGIDFVDTYFLTPLPGTPVWEYALQRGLVSEDMEWGRLNMFHAKNPIILSERVGRERITKIKRRFEWARLAIAARTAWTHPFFKGMVIAGISNVTNKFRRLSCACR